MSNTLTNIVKLLPSLPVKDIKLGEIFLVKRDFESLKALVDSALIKVKRNLRTETPREDYLKIDLDTLNMLKAEVDIYVMQLGFIDTSSDYTDDDE